MAPSSHSLATRTLRGMLWAYSSYVGGRVLVLGATLILARVLTPEDFGIVAAALVITTLLERVADLGVGQALIIAPQEEVYERAETAFVLSLGLGVALAATIAALSTPVAALFGDEDVAPVLAALGGNFVLVSLGVTHYALAQKAIDFRVRTAAELTEAVVRGATSIGLALAGAGAWSLVIGYLAGTLAMDIVLWVLVRWRPRLKPRRAHLRSLLGFGGTLSALDVVAAGIGTVDNVFVSRLFGAGALGVYSLAFRLPELVIMNLSLVAGQVLFPALAAVDAARRGAAFLLSFRYTLVVTLPIAAAMAALAEPLVLTAFGSRWTDAIDPLRALCLFSLAMTVGVPAGTAYKALGKVWILLVLALGRFAVLIGALLLFADRGLVTVALCQAGVAMAFETIALVLASRLLQVRLRAMAGAIVAPVAATGVMAAGVLGLESVLHIAPLFELVLGGLAAAVLYLGTLWVVAPEIPRRLLDTALPGRGGQPPQEPASTSS